jgi:hypothetical protein
MKPRIRVSRKLLVASIGVAAVSYVHCGGDTDSGTGTKKDAGTDHVNKDVVANLVVPEPDAAPDVAPDQDNVFDAVANLVPPDFDVVANLVAPDAGSD